jgi:hypothetical protein
LTDISILKPDSKNRRKHGPRNVGMIVDALHQVGAARSIVIDEDNTILAGNATVEAAAQAGIEKLQVVDADGSTIIAVRRSGLTPEQKRKLALWDNRTAELAEWDAEQIAADVDAGESFSEIFTDEELDEILERLAGRGKPEYSRKIVAPIYKPSGVKPRIADLYDDSRTQGLVTAIEADEGLTDEEKQFLIVAAQRHTVLHFGKIADYYAHSDERVQRLMEDSALVIIDFERAIELGFVQLTEDIIAQVRDEYGEG